LAAMSESCTMEIESIKGAKNIFFGGEGLFNTRITGPGKVYLQSMPVINTAQALSPYLDLGTDQSSSGGININLGGNR
ncbi:MAG: AIM24 family protein, partial [Oscillospiraceae bacterium]|nr:AIM24 family protein [Oscillospiraceae bacterium]